MSKLFFKYRAVVIAGLLLISLALSMFFKDGNLRDFLIGIATGIALVSFGQSLSIVKSKEKSKYVKLAERNN